MRDLGDEQRARAVRDVGARTHDEAADEVHCDSARALFGEGLQESAGDDEDASDGGAGLSAEAVGDIRGEEEDEETAEAGHGAKDAETASSRVVKV